MESQGPRHVAIIMDGNGRWALRRGVARILGHKAGALRIADIIEACPRLGIEYLTVFAFSTENWKRSPKEIEALMSLFRSYITRETARLVKNGVSVRFIGDRSRLDMGLQRLMANLERQTEGLDTLNLTVALSYGSRDEVARAVRGIAREVAREDIKPESVTEEMISARLDTSFLPDPDLVIRTSGETRLSNFLLWQSAYAEYEFVDTLWPDFTVEAFARIVGRFHMRDRRFGAKAG